MADDHDHQDAEQAPSLEVPAVPAERAQTTRLATQVLQSMSDLMAGRSTGGGSLMPPDFTDEPQAPWELPDQPDADPSAENDAAGAAAASAATPPPRTTGANAWGGYANGRIPTDALKVIGQGRHRFEAVAADAFVEMRAAAARDGVALKVSDSYRSYDEQVAVRKKKGHVVATATPGTSVHGWGKALDVDVNDPATIKWLRANAHRYGWINPKWAQQGGKSYEPWHWEHVGAALPDAPADQHLQKKGRAA